MAEKEYIDRQSTVDALARLCKRVCQYSEKQRQFMCGACPLGDAFTVIEDDLPAAEVRPVVTCGKCKYGKYTGTEWFCDKYSGHADKFGEDASYHEYHSKHWFCADGEERKHE